MTTCPKCDGRLVKRGKRKTDLGDKQLYFCNKCNKKFTIDWPKMRHTKNDVMYALRLRKKGMSLSQIQDQLKSRDVHVSRWAILKWCRKFRK